MAWLKPDWPIDYAVPNFGMDQDIVHTQKHIADQEKRLKHTWAPKQDKDGNWDVPVAITEKGKFYEYATSGEMRKMLKHKK